MRLIFKKGLIFVAGLVALCVASDAWAAGKWAVGGFVDYNSPMRKLKDRFKGERKFSGVMNYVRSEAMTISLEYNRATFAHGKLETTPFKWPVDDKFYTSPNGSSRMRVISYMVNAMVFPGQENQSHGFKPKDYRWYILIGGGFVDYKLSNTGFIFPGQTGGVTKTLDPKIIMDPQVDKRVTLSASFGAGVEAFITDGWALDVRARYNVAVGEMRPLLQWNMERVWPIQFLDFGAGMKFYFWR
jgi:opacity protein-like surface antigen